MKFMINGFEVEVKAKRAWDGRATKESTMSFMNAVSVWALEAASYNEQIGANSTARSDREASDAIYYTLEEAGCYKNI